MITDAKTLQRTANAYHETKHHSDKMFAYNVYPCTIPQDFFFVSIHWQDSVEIIYIKQGSGYVQIDFTIYHAKAGDVFFILPGHIHGIQHQEQCRMEYENIIFDLSFLGSTFFDLCSQKYWQPLINGTLSFPSYFPTEHPFNPKLRFYLDASDDLCSKKSVGYELGVKGNLMLLFSILFEIAEVPKTTKQPHIEKLKVVLSKIEMHYDQKLTVDAMAEACNYSASHFMRWFKEMTGTSFTEYLIEYRLGKAAQELKLTNDTILEIAGRTGFDNISNFNRLFKKHFGLTPSRFRAKEV